MSVNSVPNLQMVFIPSHPFTKRHKIANPNRCSKLSRTISQFKLWVFVETLDVMHLARLVCSARRASWVSLQVFPTHSRPLVRPLVGLAADEIFARDLDAVVKQWRIHSLSEQRRLSLDCILRFLRLDCKPFIYKLRRRQVALRQVHRRVCKRTLRHRLSAERNEWVSRVSALVVGL